MYELRKPERASPFLISMFVHSAFITAVSDRIPVLLPFFPPVERPLASRADLVGQEGLLIALHCSI